MINSTAATIATPEHKNDVVNVYPIAFGVSIGALSLLSVVVIASYYACSKKLRAPLRRTGSFSSNDDSSVTNDIETGLDDATLSSYPKLPYSKAAAAKKEKSRGIDENTPDEEGEKGCSICLLEFEGSDVVRVVPGCEHIYHVDCIDTWLKVHRSCPVCRSSPPPVPASESNRQRLSHGPWFVQMMR